MKWIAYYMTNNPSLWSPLIDAWELLSRPLTNPERLRVIRSALGQKSIVRFAIPCNIDNGLPDISSLHEVKRWEGELSLSFERGHTEVPGFWLGAAGYLETDGYSSSIGRTSVYMAKFVAPSGEVELVRQTPIRFTSGTGFTHNSNDHKLIELDGAQENISFLALMDSIIQALEPRTKDRQR